MEEDYFTFLRFRSISADPAYREDLLACCKWVRHYLEEGGFQVEVWETPIYPVVYAEWLGAGADKPTLLLYGHYDVQPTDPDEEWETPPFEPTRKGQEVYCRGAQDNKGQILYAMCALRSLLQADRLGINVKIIVDGEEESKSVGLSKIIPERRERLRADYMISPDFDIPSRNQPAVTLGVRGLVALTVELRGSKHDLHSGMAGGVVYNPNHALVEMLAKLRDAEGRVLVPGFYDDVEPAEEGLHLEIDEQVYREEFQAETSGGERKYSPGESAKARPTLEINGLHGGYGGPGFKTVIPACARAKLSCRLVPNQDPEKIRDSLVDYLRHHCPRGIEMQVEDHGYASAYWCSKQSPVARAMAQAYEEVMGGSCQFTLTGGSVPISAQLAEAAGAEAIFMGTGLMEDAIHAPNEHFGLDRQKLGYDIITRFVELLGGLR